MKLLPVVRGWGWSSVPTSAIVPRRVEPIVEILDKEDYREEAEIERMFRCLNVGSTYNKKGKRNHVRQRPGGRVSRKV